MFLKRCKNIVFCISYSHFISFFFMCCVVFLSAAVVGLEKTEYSIVEGSGWGVVEVCIVVTAPTGDCPIDSSFSIHFSTSDNTAGEPN